MPNHQDVESLDSDVEVLADARPPATVLRGRAAAAMLLAAAACAAIAFQGFVRAASTAAVERRSNAAASSAVNANLGDAIGLQAAYPGAAPVAAVAGSTAAAAPFAALPTGGIPPVSPIGGAAVSGELHMPPPESAALNTYFNEMMGTPSGAVATEPGSGCFDTEEEFSGLCYGKCTVLTQGKFNKRTSPWTCCEADDVKDCFISNQDRNLGICSGYDVAGDGKSCPHSPGKCLDNEELFFGNCYEKCSILTNNTKPHRTSAFSCCKTKLALSCFSPSNIAVNPSLNSGGGKGDGIAATPSDAHQPFA